MTEYMMVITDGDDVMCQVGVAGYKKEMLKKFKDILDVLSNNPKAIISLNIGVCGE